MTAVTAGLIKDWDELRADLTRKARAAGINPHDPEFRKRIAEQIAALDPEDEEDAMRWIEAVQDFDNEDAEKE